MKLPIYQVDAFSDKPFGGNPAAVVPLDDWLPDEQLQSIAAENNLSETAFFLPDHALRWFTPVAEVELCGHATLAAAHVLFTHLNHSSPSIKFQTRYRGILTVRKLAEGYRMDFPADQPKAVAEYLPVEEMIGVPVLELYKGKEDFMAIVPDEQAVLAVNPVFSAISSLPARGLLVTAPGKETDFVSRCFFPAYGVNEDPVTGSAHTLLTPCWAERLGRRELEAAQLSARGGRLKCILEGDRVLLHGNAVTYLQGTIQI